MREFLAAHIKKLLQHFWTWVGMRQDAAFELARRPGSSMRCNLFRTGSELKMQRTWKEIDPVASSNRLSSFFLAAFLAIAVSLAAVAPSPAAVLTPFTTETHFTEQAFKAAQAQDQPILIEIFATWCPTCAQQKPIVDHLVKTSEFKRLVVLRVDFDTQKNVVHAFGARMQSTLIVYHGDTLRGMSIGETDPTAIKKLLAKSLS